MSWKKLTIYEESLDTDGIIKHCLVYNNGEMQRHVYFNDMEDLLPAVNLIIDIINNVKYKVE